MLWYVCLKLSCNVYRCGYATLHHVVDKSKEDRMESFFLSETCKYLYLVRCSLSMSDIELCYDMFCHLADTIQMINTQGD